MSIRKRKSGKTDKVEKNAPTQVPSASPISIETMIVIILFVLVIGVALVYMAMGMGGERYVCGEIDVTQNIVQNGKVYDFLRDAVNRNPQYEPKFLADSIVQFDNLLSDDESRQLISVGKKHGFQDSLILNHETGNSLQKKTRTSRTLWCRNDCAGERAVQTLSRRLEDLLQISEKHFEPIQMLEYKEGQFYGNHSDFAYQFIPMLPGPRVFTLLFYLNEVDGGETYFNEIDVKVTPKAGRAILWANTPNHDVHQRDDKANHEALPVLGEGSKGDTKYAGNVWIHLRNYRDPFDHGCL